MKMFPIMLTPDYRDGGTIGHARKAGSPFVVVAVPWDMIAPHEAQAHRNHSQTIARLAERGGLAACEALAVLEDREWRWMAMSVSNAELADQVSKWLAVNSQPQT